MEGCAYIVVSGKPRDMNIINRHADQFYPLMIEESKYMTRSDLCIQEARSKILDYHKYSHKVIFLNRLVINTRKEYDEHLEICNSPDNCFRNRFFEDLIFFFNEEIEENTKYIDQTEFSSEDKKHVFTFEDNVIAHLKTINLGQEITYEDLTKELSELKEYLYMNKKNWLQLFSGKIVEMVAGGIIEEATAKTIVDFVKIEYKSILRN